MPQRKKHPQSDEGQFIPYTASDKLVVPVYAAEVGIPDGERAASARLYRNLHHQTISGYNDPLSAAYVLDALQRWAPAYYIRARYMSAHLNRKQNHILFDVITCGKIIAELAERGREAFADYPDLIPIVTRVDARGTYYVINSLPSTYRWFWKVRKQLGAICASIMEAEHRDLAARRRTDSAWDGIDFTPEF